MEFINPEGLRIDGRRAEELRRFHGEMGVLQNCTGSASLNMGNTQVLASILGPRELLRSTAVKERQKAVLTCQFSNTIIATDQKRKKGKNDKKSLEVENLVVETFQNIIMLEQYPRSQIDIVVQVLQGDGSAKAAMINCVTLALINAGIPMRDFVCCCAVGLLESTPVLDLNYVEEAAEGPNIPIAIIPTSQKIISIQMDSKMSLDEFESAVQLGTEGCKIVHSLMQQIVKKHLESKIIN